MVWRATADACGPRGFGFGFWNYLTGQNWLTPHLSQAERTKALTGCCIVLLRQSGNQGAFAFSAMNARLWALNVEHKVNRWALVSSC